VTVKGREVSFADGRLDFAPPRRDLPIYVASQRAGGCRVAGRVADGAIMQGAVADPLVRFFRETVHGAARDAGRDPARVALVARLNVCVADDRAAARDVMRPGLVRSLSAQRPDFFTFTTAGLTLPATLRDKVLALPYTHDPAPLRAVAPEVSDAFVDALTLTGPPDAIAPEIVRLARRGITEIMVYALAVDGRIETTIERFQTEVMPRVRALLG
jgi:5,10-methylenetetrahydromethanopterin reductase